VPRRKKKTTRRRDTSIRLLQVAEAYTYANIATTNIFMASVPQFVMGEADISQAGSTYNLASYATGSVGGGSWGIVPISIRDIAKNPQLAFDAASINIKNNMWTMVGQFFTAKIGFKFGKRLLRQPISLLNRSIFKPLAMGIKL